MTDDSISYYYMHRHMIVSLELVDYISSGPSVITLFRHG